MISLIVATSLGVRPAAAEDPQPAAAAAEDGDTKREAKNQPAQAEGNQTAAAPVSGAVPGRARIESKLPPPAADEKSADDSVLPERLRYQPDPKEAPEQLWKPAKPEKSGTDPKKVIGIIAGSLGLAGIGVGATTSIMAANQNKSGVDRQCSDTLRMCSRDSKFAASNGASLARVSAVGWAVGAVGVGVGAYFLLSKDKRTGKETRLGADIYQGGGGVRVNRSW